MPTSPSFAPQARSRRAAPSAAGVRGLLMALLIGIALWAAAIWIVSRIV